MDTRPYYLAEPTIGVEYLEVDECPTIVQKLTNQPMDQLAEVFDSAFAAVLAASEMLGTYPSGPAFALYTGMPTDTVSLEIGVPVEQPLTETSASSDDLMVQPSTLPGGSVARMTYMGPYDGLGDAWGEMMRIVAADGKQPDLPFWELYISEPGPDVDPATLRTDLVTKIRS